MITKMEKQKGSDSSTTFFYPPDFYSKRTVMPLFKFEEIKERNIPCFQKMSFILPSSSFFVAQACRSPILFLCKCLIYIQLVLTILFTVNNLFRAYDSLCMCLIRNKFLSLNFKVNLHPAGRTALENPLNYTQNYFPGRLR